MTKRKAPEPLVIPDTPEAHEALKKIGAEMIERQKAYEAQLAAELENPSSLLATTMRSFGIDPVAVASHRKK